jgi:hypothetical protein
MGSFSFHVYLVSPFILSQVFANGVKLDKYSISHAQLTSGFSTGSDVTTLLFK